MTHDVIEALRRVPLLGGLNERELERFARDFTERSIPAGSSMGGGARFFRRGKPVGQAVDGPESDQRVHPAEQDIHEVVLGRVDERERHQQRVRRQQHPAPPRHQAPENQSVISRV